MGNDLIAVAKTTKYPPGAFEFVQQGLEFTVNRLHGQAKADNEPGSRHVTGQDLCMGLRDYAIAQYGLLARTVLRRWQITRCEDFGEMVFAMVDAGLMHKNEDDSIRDFVDVFDFADAFATTLDLKDRKAE
jgi:uncharacterized repeat protein (TIGR04138 family)